ncbi:hypothetical protein EQV77_06155 [Halobacillus fulvus]|nr:hypothetical protein EQV77_06155 [Halobacillus fulvus]
MKDLLFFIMILMIIGGVFGFAISGPTGLLLGMIISLLLFIIYQLHKLIEMYQKRNSEKE